MSDSSYYDVFDQRHESTSTSSVPETTQIVVSVTPLPIYTTSTSSVTTSCTSSFGPSEANSNLLKSGDPAKVRATYWTPPDGEGPPAKYPNRPPYEQTYPRVHYSNTMPQPLPHKDTVYRPIAISISPNNVRHRPSHAVCHQHHVEPATIPVPMHTPRPEPSVYLSPFGTRNREVMIGLRSMFNRYSRDFGNLRFFRAVKDDSVSRVMKYYNYICN